MAGKLRLAVTTVAFAAAVASAVPGVAAGSECSGASEPSRPNGALAPDPTGQLPYVYTGGDDPTSGGGFVGVSGDSGYLEIDGNVNTTSGGVSGRETSSGSNGTVRMTSAGPVGCVNGTSVP